MPSLYMFQGNTQVQCARQVQQAGVGAAGVRARGAGRRRRGGRLCGGAGLQQDL